MKEIGRLFHLATKLHGWLSCLVRLHDWWKVSTGPTKAVCMRCPARRYA